MPRFPLSRPARIGVFASGNGSNFQALLDAFPPPSAGAGDGLGSVVVLVSDKAGAHALERARRARVPAVHAAWPRPSGRAVFEAAAQAALEAHQVDLVCLAGFMRILSPAFVGRWRGRILNIHPSLLPAFPGLHAQRQAIDAGATESGCTVHFVDEGIDTGAPIVQRRVPVLPGDDEAALADRIRAEEHRAYAAAVRSVLRGDAAPKGGEREGRALQAPEAGVST